jgi:hypothetical protein
MGIDECFQLHTRLISFHAVFSATVHWHISAFPNFLLHHRLKLKNCTSLRLDSASFATGASVTRATSSDGSTASFKSSDVMLPSMASGVSATATASFSSRMHDAHAFKVIALKPPPGTASQPDASRCFLGDKTVSPEVLARVVLQARLRESDSRRELERERARTKELEALAQQLAKELRAARSAVARQADGSSG